MKKEEATVLLESELAVLLGKQPQSFDEELETALKMGGLLETYMQTFGKSHRIRNGVLPSYSALVKRLRLHSAHTFRLRCLAKWNNAEPNAIANSGVKHISGLFKMALTFCRGCELRKRKSMGFWLEPEEADRFVEHCKSLNLSISECVRRALSADLLKHNKAPLACEHRPRAFSETCGRDHVSPEKTSR